MTKLFLLNILMLVNMIWANDMSDSEVQKFRQDVLMQHNKLRARHQAPMLKLNRELNEIAQEKAIEFLTSDTFSKPLYHKQPLGFNKLKYTGTRPFLSKWFTDYFYSKGSQFDYTVESLQNKHGFTQIVWKSSREIGLGVEKIGNTISIVALYFPAGNIIGTVLQNVKAPINSVPHTEIDSFSDNQKETKIIEQTSEQKEISEKLKLVYDLIKIKIDELNQNLNSFAKTIKKFKINN